MKVKPLSVSVRIRETPIMASWLIEWLWWTGEDHCFVPGTMVAQFSSASSRNRYVDQYTRLNRANTSGNVMREMTSILFERVGNLDNQVRQQLSLLGCMWISHWRTFSRVSASPGWRTKGFCNTRIPYNICHQGKCPGELRATVRTKTQVPIEISSRSHAMFL